MGRELCVISGAEVCQEDGILSSIIIPLEIKENYYFSIFHLFLWLRFKILSMMMAEMNLTLLLQGDKIT